MYRLRKLSPKLVDINATSQNDRGLPSSRRGRRTEKHVPADAGCLLLFELVTLLSHARHGLYTRSVFLLTTSDFPENKLRS